MPVIYGGNKVTYLSDEESKNYDFSSLMEQATTQENIIGQEDYSSLIQGNTETTVQTTKTIIENTQPIQVQDYSQISPVQELGFGEYQRTSY